MFNPEWIGYIAGACTTCAYLPQAAKAIRTRDTRSISLAMYVVMTTGGALWAAYGVMIGSMSVIVTNVVTFMMTVLILMTKLRHG